MTSAVALRGAMAPEELPAQLRAADIVVAPSRREGFGRAVLEAMASGTPVVCTNAGGLRDFVRHEHNSLVVDVDAPEQIASAVERLCDDRELRQRISAGARETAAAYPLAACAARVRELYERVLSTP